MALNVIRKRFAVLFTLLLLSLLVVPSVYAQPTGLDSLSDIFLQEVEWPPFGENEKTDVPVFFIALSLLLLMSLLYAASHVVPLFKDTPHKNAVLLFLFAFSAIPVFGSGFVGNLWALTNFASNSFIVVSYIAIIAILVLIALRGGSAVSAAMPQGAKDAAKKGMKGAGDKVIGGTARKAERELKEESAVAKEID